MDVFALITKHEGDRAFPYCDKCGQRIKRQLYYWACGCRVPMERPGNMTIGRGHNLEVSGLGIAARLSQLSDDILVCESDLSSYGWFRTLDAVRKAGFVDMRFCLGPGGFRKFPKMLAAAEIGQWGAAADEMLSSEWDGEEPTRASEDAYIVRTGRWPEGEVQ